MEPNWQTTQPQPVQGRAERPSVWEDGGNEGRVQQPLGTGGAYPRSGSQPPRYDRPATAPYPGGRYDTGRGYPPPAPGGQAWQPGQPMSATGPVPDPFEEPANAPELRSARSDNLYKRDDRFWERVGNTGAYPPAGQSQRPKRADGHTLRWVILIVVILAVIGGLIYGTAFRVDSIVVQGSRTIPDEEIIRLSGITPGMNTFSINDATVEKGIESNRYLSFVCVDKQRPDRVVIQVKERTPAAIVKYCGILYVIDNRGMVLEESLNTDEEPAGLVSVEGLSIKSCRLGEQIILNNMAQLKTYTEMIVEMRAMSALEKMKELDLSNMDNIFLVSRDGYSVRMGNSHEIHKKLRALLLTIEKLDANGYLNKGGTIDVSNQVNPTYIPQGDWLQSP